MTFKHAKFEDSPVMRSLEKVAQQKGLVKPEPLNKTAAVKKASLAPTESLMDNVLKLCAGLRERGFEKQASELETNLVNYKRAQTLYEAFKETGDDLVQSAHPEGSHKLEGVDSDEAVFEDILDQMSKALEVVNKQPTGKLSKAEAAIQAVKVAIGATPLDLNQLYAQAQDKLEKFRSVESSIATMVGEQADYNSDIFATIKSVLDKKQVHQATAGGMFGSSDVASSLLKAYDDFVDGVKPSYFNLPWEHSAFSPTEQQNWEQIQKYLPVLKKYADAFHAIVSQIDSIESGNQSQIDQKAVSEFDPEGKAAPNAPAPAASAQLLQKYNDLISAANRDIARVQAKGLPNATQLVAWLNGARDKFFAPSLQQYSSSQYKDDKDVMDGFSKKYDGYKSKLDAFEQRWLS